MTGVALADTLLGDRCRGCLFVSRGGGSPTGWPLAFTRLEDGLWSTTYTTAAKTRRISSADRATCVVFESEHDPYPYAVLQGLARIVQPTTELVMRFLGSDSSVPPTPLPRVADRLLSGKRVFIQFRPATTPAMFGRDA